MKKGGSFLQNAFLKATLDLCVGDDSWEDGRLSIESDRHGPKTFILCSFLNLTQVKYFLESLN